MRRIILLLTLLVAASAGATAQTIPVEQIPTSAQQTLQRVSGGQVVVRVTPREIRGRTVYDIELDIPRAVNRYVRIAGTGELLADTRPRSR